MQSALKINNITKLYAANRGARNISLELMPGEVCGLLGPNGSGKTTIMKVAAGLIRADEGTVEVFGEDTLRAPEAAAKRMGCLIEAPALYGHMSAKKNLRLAARVRAAALGESFDIDEECMRVLRLVHLERYASDKTQRFSLGMKQRMGIALALIGSPDLLILDEPANGLDIEGIVEIRELIRSLAEDYGRAVLVSSHLAGELEKTCSRAVVLHEGELLADVPMSRALAGGATLEEYYLERVREHRAANMPPVISPVRGKDGAQ